MASLVEQFVPPYEDPELDRTFFEGLLREIDRRMAALEILKGGLEGALANATTLAVQRIDEYLAPRIAVVNNQLAELQALYQSLLVASENIAEATLSQLQPLIDAKFATIDAGITEMETIIATANTAITAAEAATSAANAAAAGVGAAIADAQRFTLSRMRQLAG